jgi:hypothetical protein
VDQVVRGYAEVAFALEGRKTIPYSSRTRREAEGLTDVLHNGVEAVRFETAEADVIIREIAPALAPVPPPAQPVGSYGAVTGRVQTLIS